MYRLITIILLLGLACPSQANWSQRIEDQRAAFRDAWPRAMDGDASGIRKNQLLLADYPLYPDLQAAWLRTQVGKINDGEIENFVSGHSSSSAVRDLRYRWARSLAKRGLWEKYLVVYQSSYADRGDEELDCLALTARLRLGPDENFAADTLAFWMNGESRASECDPVFKAINDQGVILSEHRLQRIDLALEEREFELASWLAKPLQATDKERVQQWRRMRQNPATALAKADKLPDSEDTREMIIYGLKRLSRRDLDKSRALWAKHEDNFAFETQQRKSMLRSFALRAARDNVPQAREQIFALENDVIDDNLLEWGVRIALHERDWESVSRAIALMSNSNKAESKWRYWDARALEAVGRRDEAIAIYSKLAQSRGYYQFLAADRLDAPYDYNHIPATPDEALLVQLETADGLVRARELFFVDLHGKGRSEWDRSVKALSRPERAQTAILASRWGWHSRAIATAVNSGVRDDLSLSYPMAFRDLIESNTQQLGLPTTWAFGIARSESLFMPDVTSSAGALGVMQVTPATGRITARQARMRYRGSYSLLDPKENIALGTFYLDRMYARFDDHQVLATAAYNAGPHRVARWLPEDEPVAADIWVETVPYKETRGYLRRVLSADAIFNWRLTGETRRLATIMPPVPTRSN